MLKIFLKHEKNQLYNTESCYMEIAVDADDAKHNSEGFVMHTNI